VQGVVPAAVVVRPYSPPAFSSGSVTVSPPASDDVNHPAHYTRAGIECIQALEAMIAKWPARTAYLLGNVLKYLWRHQDKTPLLSLKKARWYLDREIAALEAPSPASPGLTAGSSTSAGAPPYPSRRVN
jgi:hypothetical protein